MFVNTCSSLKSAIAVLHVPSNSFHVSAWNTIHTKRHQMGRNGGRLSSPSSRRIKLEKSSTYARFRAYSFAFPPSRGLCYSQSQPWLGSASDSPPSPSLCQHSSASSASPPAFPQSLFYSSQSVLSRAS